VLVVLVGTVVVGLAIAAYTVRALAGLSDELPGYQANLATQIATLEGWLAGVGVTLPTSLRAVVDPQKLVTVGVAGLRGLFSGLSLVFLVLLLFIFIALDSPRLKARLKLHHDPEAPHAGRLLKLAADMLAFARVRAINNLFVSAVLVLVLWLLGVPLAGLWGVLAFFLGFIPTIGLPLAVAPAAVLALLDSGWVTALIVVGAAIVINLIGDDVITPRLAGQALEMPAAVVFASFLLWGFIFGIIGALISVPLTLVVIAGLDGYDRTRWMADLLRGGTIKPGDEPPREDTGNGGLRKAA
jgi:predicted PurR-regulated permease PerM